MASSNDDRASSGGAAPAVSETLRRLAEQNQWPEDLTRRIAALHVPDSSLNTWTWYGLNPEQAAAQLAWHERLTIGDLRGRTAVFTDNDAFSALWADSPEEIGEWEITVDRCAYQQLRKR